jgi:hypothetical protein
MHENDRRSADSRMFHTEFTESITAGIIEPWDHRVHRDILERPSVSSVPDRLLEIDPREVNLVPAPVLLNHSFGGKGITAACHSTETPLLGCADGQKKG